MKLSVYTKEGKEAGRQVELTDAIFGIEPSDHAIYQDVRLILANRRQGTHKAKERGEIHGTGKKPFRQKGTGGARAGDRKSPLWRHGGRVFGPRPRDYGFKLNRKVKELARRSALTYKAKESSITVVENFTMAAPKTKEFVKMLEALKLNDKKVLMVLAGDNENVYKSGRNIPNAKIIRVADLNTYDILNAGSLLFIEEAVGQIQENLG